MADGSLSQFKATLARKKARDEKKRNKFESSITSATQNKPEYNFPKLSETELNLVKDKIRKKLKSEKKKETIRLGIIFIFFALIVLLLLSNLS